MNKRIEELKSKNKELTDLNNKDFNNWTKIKNEGKSKIPLFTMLIS